MSEKIDLPQIEIGGLIPFTTIDYPEKLAAVLFLNGCPFRCAYCSNPHLFELRSGEYDPEKVFEWLKSRIGKLTAVVFSGGEALMQGDKALDFMRAVKGLGFAVGLHTNGFYPEIMQRGLDTIDWVGLDIKTVSKNYKKLTGLAAYDKVMQSCDILVKAGKPFEARITCDPRYVSIDDVKSLAADLAARGVADFALQKYRPYDEPENAKTTEAERASFFNDAELREYLKKIFKNVAFREN